MIGRRCKAGDSLSRAALIARALTRRIPAGAAHVLGGCNSRRSSPGYAVRRARCAAPRARGDPYSVGGISSSSTSAAHRSAAMAGGARPDPFRTRKLSRRAPMVLRGQPVGEQGAADRWTALDPHPAGSGAGAPRGCPAAPPSFFPYALAGPSGALFSWGESPRLWNRIIRLFVCGLDEPSDTRGRVAPFLWRAFLALRDPLGEKAFVLSGAEGPCSRIRALGAAYRLGWSIHLRKRCPAVRSVYGPFRFRRAILPRSRASFIVDPWLRRLNGIPERVFQAA